MAIITRKSITSSLRGQQFISTKDLTKKKPEKKLTVSLSKNGGRNSYGRITVRHRGGGAKRKYRVIDFKRTYKDIPGKVIAFEYDPNRNVSIALIAYRNGAKSYILRPEGLKLGDTILNSSRAEAKVGNSMPLRNVPIGFFVHNIELVPGQGGKLARSAGSAIQLLGKEGNLAILKMPSGETRTVFLDNWTTIGTLANADYKNITLGKAGRRRHMGFRPSVRGMAMNPVDHPHGGGEGRSKSGSHPVTPWGKSCKGARTRKRKSSAILKRRK
ncbi:50S ribosomal protein L2 [Candidatus Dependentiae bacterium]|nr:50S ribosomal protein L2 [Candidatus Dependentiae bacterium]